MTSIKSRIAKMKTRQAAELRRSLKRPGTRAEKLASVPSEAISYDDLRARDGDACQLCGGDIDFDAPYRLADGTVNRQYRTLDHVWPIELGGWDVLGNAQAVHYACNSAKADRVNEDDLDAWTEFLTARRVPFSINALGHPVVEAVSLKGFMQ